MRRAALALAVLVCGSLTGAPAPLSAAPAIGAWAPCAAGTRDDASLTAKRRASGISRLVGRHGDPRGGAPPALALPVGRVSPAVRSLAPTIAISPPPALAGQAIAHPGLARGPPPRR